VPRHRLRDAAGTLGWREEEEVFACAMSVVDISGVGAAVLADRCPGVAEPVWIRLESGAAGAERIDARVVTTSAEPGGKFMVRLRFTSWIALGNVLDQHEEHRVWQRYPARETRGKLVWEDREGERAAPAELMNISGGGAAVVTDAVVPEGRPIWLSLAAEEYEEMTPVECELVAMSMDASGLRMARLRFVEPCPMELFETVVHGGPSVV
jgi:hypothetical protein